MTKDISYINRRWLHWLSDYIKGVICLTFYCVMSFRNTEIAETLPGYPVICLRSQYKGECIDCLVFFPISTLRRRQNDRHFAARSFKFIFLMKSVCFESNITKAYSWTHFSKIWIKARNFSFNKITLKLCPIENKSTVVRVMVLVLNTANTCTTVD